MKTIGDDFVGQNRHLLNHKKCVFIVGAGISVASGIPDFRSPDGIFSLLRQQLRIDGRQLFTYNFGIREGTREIYLKYIADLKRLCDRSQPNAVHRFLAKFPRSRTYTQNIDGLEERAGMQFGRTDGTRGVYLHGNLQLLQCRYCGYKEPFGDGAAEEFSQGLDRTCTLCLERREKCIRNNIRKRPIGVMHPGIIHYQQAHPDGAFIGKMTERDTDCDLLIVIGTSLKVEGIKRMVKMFSKYPGVMGRRIFVNLTRPSKEWESVFDYFYEGDCSNFVAAVEGGTARAVDAKVGAAGDREPGAGSAERLDHTRPELRPALTLTDMPACVESCVPASSASLCLRKSLDTQCAAPRELSVRKLSIDLKRTSLRDKCSDSHCNESYLSTERYDDALLRGEAPEEKPAIVNRLEKLADTFDDADAISRPVLDDAVKSACPTRISPSELLGASEFIQMQPDSSCVDLEEEIQKAVAGPAEQKTGPVPGPAAVDLTPKKRPKRKAARR